MAEINYSIAAMMNPSSKEAAPKYYAKMQASGEVDLDDMAEEISYATTLTDGDVLNVLRALIKQMKKNLMAGKIVRMEKFGSFQFQICSEGAETEKGFTPSNIKKVNIQFRPGALVREAQNLKTLTFKKVPRKTDKAPADSEANEG
jgi:predicted histone-like DNA-binding protein|nr:MAG TPA: DNA-binding protein [Caudoviricetes sp.]